MKENIIKMRGLKKSYIIAGKPVDILRGIDLEVKKGDFVAIMGPSGSGKSTLMNVIGILDSASSGEYIFGNMNIKNFDDDTQAIFRRDKIGFVFQGYNLLPRMKAWEQVVLALVYKGWGYNKRFKRAQELLSLVGLGDKMESTPDMLSGGEQQRVAIARALSCDPELILADEPTGALDSVTSTSLLRLLTDLNKKGKTILMITHDADVSQYANHTIHIKDGLIHKIER